MLRLTLQPTNGTLFWNSETAPEAIRRLSPFWTVGTETFTEKNNAFSIFDNKPLQHVLTGSIHGRSCFLGFEPKEQRYYFAKGIGWIWVTGYSRNDGSYGIFPLWGAERERDFCNELTALGIETVRPEAIFLHKEIPNASGEPHNAETIPDLDGTPAKPCLYVYSSKTRWRLADLPYLSKQERNKIWQDTEPKEYLRNVLGKLSQSVRLLHNAGGYDYSLSPHNAFIDGVRIDFEYGVLPNYPHHESTLNERSEVWRDKELDGLREIAWFLADLMQLDISGNELNSWWQDAFGSF